MKHKNILTIHLGKGSLHLSRDDGGFVVIPTKRSAWRNPFLSLLAFTIILILGPLFYFRFLHPNPASAGWFNDSWGYRKAVNITNTSGSALTDFQVSISIGTSANIVAGKMKSDCSDIRITDTNGKLLPHWIEGPCNSISDATVWTKVPSLPTSGQTVYVYYGNPSATNTSSTTNTFIREITGVAGAWKMDENTGTTIIDYSGIGNTGSFGTGSSAPAWTTGMMGTGLSFDGVADYVQVSSTFGIGANNVSISTWVYIPSASDHGAFIKIGGSGDGYGIGVGAGTFDDTSLGNNLIILYEGVRWVNTNKSIGTGWHHVAMAVDNSGTPTVFLDGSKINTYSGTTPRTPTTGTSIGGYRPGPTYIRYFNGIIDEPRVYNHALSDTEVYDLYGNGGNNYGYVTTNYPGKELVRKYAAAPPTSSLSSTEEQSKGPAAYWKFDEGQGTSINDSGQARMTGTLGSGTSAPAWQTEDMCISGKCLKYDGNDFVSVGSTAKDVQTISLWVKPTTTTQNFIDLDGGTHYISDSSGAVSATGFDTPTIYVNGRSNGTLTANQWNHIEVTTVTSFDATNIKLGRRTTNYLTGFMDEIKIFNYARSATEINVDYNAGKGHASSSKGSSVIASSAKQSQDAFSNGLVGYWKMDEGIGNTAATVINDSSGIGNTGTFGIGDSAPGWNAGMYGVGVSFNGTTNFINLGNDSNMNFGNSNSYSIQFWLKKTGSFKNYDEIISKSQTGDARFHFLIDSGGILYRWGDSYKFTGPTISLNRWTHVVYTYSANGSNNGTEKFYVDGVNTSTRTGLMPAWNSSGNFWLGFHSLLGGSWPLNGFLDEIRFYNRALSPAEVSQLYNWAPGPIAYYDFNEGVGSSVYDSSGNNYHGLWSGTGTHWGAGKYGKAGKFNGTDDLVNLGNPSLLNVGTGSFTFSFWLNQPRFTGSYDMPFFKGGSSAGTVGYDFEFGSSGGAPGGNICDGTTGVKFVTMGSKLLNQWVYYTMVVDRNKNTLYGYQNGVQKGTKDITGVGSLSSANSATFSNSSYKLFGFLDEVRVYNYVRSPSQITEDMNAGHPAGGSPVGSQLLYWKFDDGYGRTAKDSSPQKNNGTLSVNRTGWALPAWSDGKLGKSLYFSGIGTSFPYVTAASINTGSTNSGDRLTFTMWLKPEATQNGGWIIRNGTGTDENYGFNLSSLTNNLFKMTVTGYASAAFRTVNSTNNIVPANQWSHLGLVYSQGEWVKVYLNGNLKETIAWPWNTALSTSSFNVAGHNGTTGQQFNGYIDEFKVYAGELTPDEIKIDYNRGQSLQLGSLSSGTGNTSPNTANSQLYCVPGDTAACLPPVGEWNFNEGVGTSAYDTSGNGNNGVLGTGSSAPTWTAGKHGKGLKFDGVDDIVSIVDSSSLRNLPSSALTLETWVKASSYSDYSFIIGKRIVGTGYYGLFARVSGNSLFFSTYIYTQSSPWAITTTSTTFQKNVFTHVATTYDSTTKKARIFINGREAAYSQQQASTSDSADDTNRTMSIGAYSPNGANFNGILDDLRIYNYARTPAQIAWDYNWGEPVAYFKFDKCQGTTAYDSMNLNHATIYIGATGTQSAVGTCSLGIGSTTAWGIGATGKYSTSLNFDGTDDYAVTANVALLAGAGQSAPGISYGAWVYPTASVASKTIINKGNEFKLETDANSNANCNVYANGGWKTAAVSSSLFPLSTWSHLLCVYDGSNTKVYVNGLLSGTQATTGSIVSLSSTALSIARDPAPSQYFSGQIDEVKVWNYPLTSTQIKNEYNQGSGVRFGPLTGSP